MNKKTTTICAIAGLVVIAVVAAIAIWVGNRQTNDEGAGPLYTEPSIDAPETEQPQATVTDEPTDAEEANPDQDLHHDDHEGSDDFITVYEDTAAGFVREWLTWNSEESAESRSARLAPYLAANADLPGKPNLYTNSKGDLLNLKSTIHVDDIVFAGFDSQSEDASTWTFTVTVRFTANYQYNRQSQDFIDQRKWKVNLPSSGPIKVLSIEEPSRW